MPERYAEAICLASTLNLSREDWLKVRQRGIGSSDAAAAVGLSQYTSPLALWLEKTNRHEHEDISQKEAVVWGMILEPIVAKVYAERTGRKVRRLNYVLQHEKHGFMLANLDRLTQCPIEGVGVLEIKTAGHFSAKQWEEGVPLAYQCQVLHQLAVTGHAWADVAVLIGGQDFRIYRINRDEDKIADLIEREAQFWAHVINDTPPKADGSKSASLALQWQYPLDDGSTIDLSESTEANHLFANYLAIRQRKDEIETHEEQLKQQLQTHIGNASAAQFLGGQITWKATKDKNSTNLKQLALDHPDLIKQYIQTSKGSRRLVVQA